MAKYEKLSINVDPSICRYFEQQTDKDTIINNLLGDYIATHPLYTSESGEIIDYETEMEIETSDWEGFGGEWQAEPISKPKKKK